MQIGGTKHITRAMCARARVVVVGCAFRQQSLGAGEKDDRDVIAAIEASKRENDNKEEARQRAAGEEEEEEEEDPEVLKAIAESRWDTYFLIRTAQ